MRSVERWLLTAAFLAATAWAIATARGLDGELWALAAKGTMAPLLAVVALARRRDVPGAGLLAAALVCHGAGDVLLEWRLLVGMGAFFVGHLAYAALFWRHRIDVDDIGGRERLRLGLLALTGALALGFVSPNLYGLMAIGVPVYAVGLLLMAGTAQLSARGGLWVPAGGLLFVLSDLLLAFALYGDGSVDLRRFVWPIYVAAQAALALGWILDRGATVLPEADGGDVPPSAAND